MISLKKEVERLSSPDYSPGYTAPEDLSGQRLAYSDSSLGAVDSESGVRSPSLPSRGSVRRALTCSANDFGWYPQIRQEIGAYRETIVTLYLTDDGEIVINANHASAWQIDAAGSFAFDIEFGEDLDPLDDNAAEISVVTSILVIMRLQAGAVVAWPSGIKWPADTPAGTWDPPEAEREDVYVLWHTDLLGWHGNIVQQGYA